MQVFLLLLIFITVYLMFFYIFSACFLTKRIIGLRLEGISKQGMKGLNDELGESLFIRILRPITDSVSRTVLKATPKEIISALDKRVILAGNPFSLGVKDWINIQAILIACLPLITIGAGYTFGVETGRTIQISAGEIILSLTLPNLILNRMARERQGKILDSLPDVLDLLTVSVEAGLGFDGALAKVVDKMPGPLAVEFDYVLQEMKMGKQKKESLKDMADRIGIQDLSAFVNSIIQADQLGVSIGNVLRIQSEQIRRNKRQRIQEKAMKAPVKMLIPMVLFIFPTIFSVLLGPVVIKVLRIFMK